MNSNHDQNSNQLQNVSQDRQPENNYQQIKLLDEQALSKVIQVIEEKVYQRLIRKTIKYKLTETLKQRKIITSEDQFHYHEYLQEIHRALRPNADTLEKWILFNILSREQHIQFKKQMHQVNERKAKKAAQIQALIQKIGEKYQAKKVDEAIRKFNEIRKSSKGKFTPLDQIKVKNQQIRQLLQKRNNNDMLQIKKAAEQIKQYQMNLQKSTTICLDKLDKLLL